MDHNRPGAGQPLRRCRLPWPKEVFFPRDVAKVKRVGLMIAREGYFLSKAEWNQSFPDYKPSELGAVSLQGFPGIQNLQTMIGRTGGMG